MWKTSIAVVHNGTITNYKDLRSELINKNHFFSSDIDSEVIAHLIEKNLNYYNDFETGIKNTIKQLEGTFTFTAIYNEDPGKVYIYRHHFPVVVLKTKEKIFFSSERKSLTKIFNEKFRVKNLNTNELISLYY